MEGIKAMLPAPGSGPPPTPEAMKAIQAKVNKSKYTHVAMSIAIGCI